MSPAMMAFVTEAESKLTDRYQTTVPEPVRVALQLSKGAKLRYQIRKGEVVLQRADVADEDPALRPYLRMLVNDMRAHPERLQAVDPDLIRRARSLVAGVEFDLDAPLDPNDE